MSDKIFPETEFFEINLYDFLNEMGGDKVKEILSSFQCPQNKDVENFLREKAILFSERRFARTHLVFWRADANGWAKEQKELVGYYAITNKTITVYKEMISNTVWKKFSAYGDTSSGDGRCTVPALLIGQLGKNFQNGNECLISGKDLLELALQKIHKVYKAIGGRIVYVECEDIPELVRFYENNGFKVLGNRVCDYDETDIKGQYLVQLYKFI